MTIICRRLLSLAVCPEQGNQPLLACWPPGLENGRYRECRTFSGDRIDLRRSNPASVSRGKPRGGYSRPYPAGLAKGDHP